MSSYGDRNGNGSSSRKKNGRGTGNGSGHKASGKTYHFQTKPQSAYAIDDERNATNTAASSSMTLPKRASRKLSSGPFSDSVEFEEAGDEEMFQSVHARKSRLSAERANEENNSGDAAGGSSNSLQLFRFSVAVSVLMMCFLVYTIISKDSEEEHKAQQEQQYHHHHNSYDSPYTFDEGTKPAVIPMGTYDNYDDTNMYNRGHDNMSGDKDTAVASPLVSSTSNSFPDIESVEDFTVPSPFDVKLADVYDFPVTDLQTAFFWYIPRSGGTTLEVILSECLGLTVASKAGADVDPEQDSLKIVQQPDSKSVMGDALNYVNVDVTTPDGIQKAKQMGLVSSGFADVIISPRVYDSMDLFFENMQGRMFTVIRNPIDRAVSEYNYLKKASWEPTYHPDFMDMTLLEYAQSSYIEDNWMVRSLTNNLSAGTIPSDALEKAKTILKEKCLVGLFEKLQASVNRIDDYFGWDISILRKSSDAWNCQVNYISDGVNAGADKQRVVEEGTEEWLAIFQHNELDMELYTYAQHLYREQQDIPAFGIN